MMEFTKPTTPLTRSSSRRIILEYKIVEETHAQGQPVSIEKIHTSPGEGEKTIKWINKQLREAQYLIIHLREENKISELNTERHFQECGPAINFFCAALSNSQSKLRRNALLFRQVGNLKRQNLSLRKANRSLKQRMKVDDETMGKLDLLAEVDDI